MNYRKLRAIAMGGVLAAVAAMGFATPSSALQIYRHYRDACPGWASRATRMRCFDCVERRVVNGSQVWINTCGYPLN